MLSHRAALPLSCQALACVTGVIRRDLAAIGSGWRKLHPCVQHSLLAHPGRPGRRRPALQPGKHQEHDLNPQVIASPGGDNPLSLRDICRISARSRRTKLSAGPLMC